MSAVASRSSVFRVAVVRISSLSDLTSTRHVQCFLVLVGQTLYDSFPDAAAEHCRDAMAQGRFQQLGCGLSGGVWNLYRPAGECPC